MHYSLDIETYSDLDLTVVGAFRYAQADANAEIMMAAVARDEEPPLLWMHPRHRHVRPCDAGAEKLMAEMLASDAPVYAHNAMFEMALCQGTGQFEIALERWRCTETLASFAGIRPSLACAGLDLALDVTKDPIGKKCIFTFSLPVDGRRVMPDEEPALFHTFCEYCKNDVAVEQRLSRMLERFDLELYPHMLAAYHATLRLNQRGYPIDAALLEHCASEYAERCAEVAETFRAGTRMSLGDLRAQVLETSSQPELLGAQPTQISAQQVKRACGYATLREARDLIARADGDLEVIRDQTSIAPTQRDRFLRWARVRGYRAKDLQRDTIDAHLGDVSGGARDILEAYATLSYAAPKKVESMQRGLCADETIKGAFIFGGTRTMRWTGVKTQPQNFKKSPKSDQAGILYRMHMGEPLSVEDIAKGVRLLVRTPEGFTRSDYSAIECRILNAIAGQTDVMDMFRAEQDVYAHTAAKIFCIGVERVTGAQKNLGKVTELGCQYGLWVNGFLRTCEAWGVPDVDETLGRACVIGYRESHAKVVEFWAKCESSFCAALAQPGKDYVISKEFGIYAIVKNLAIGQGKSVKVAQIFLPSGRPINFYDAKMSAKRDAKGNYPISYWGTTVGESAWGHVTTYGAKIAENVTQAIAADIMMIALANLEARGLHPRMTIHDEAVGDRSDVGAFAAAMTDLPPWTDGMLITCETEHRASYGGL